jgi:hypothetical protein
VARLLVPNRWRILRYRPAQDMLGNPKEHAMTKFHAGQKVEVPNIGKGKIIEMAGFKASPKQPDQIWWWLQFHDGSTRIFDQDRILAVSP